MYDSMRVQIFECINALDHVALHLDLSESLPPSQHLIHRLVLAEFQQDVNVFCIFEMFKSDYVVVVQRSVDFDFAHKFLLRSGFSQTCFGDDFCSADFTVFEVHDFIDSCEPAFSEESSLLVSSDCDVAVDFD